MFDYEKFIITYCPVFVWVSANDLVLMADEVTLDYSVKSLKNHIYRLAAEGVLISKDVPGRNGKLYRKRGRNEHV